MTNFYLHDKKILLGITGCIAAYKSAALVSALTQAGAKVRVIMTKNAQEFITPLTLQTLSKHSVYTEMFNQKQEMEIGHISLARWADLIVIAPASANCIARLAHGFADDLLSTVCLASKAPIALAPGMNYVMWENPITQQNLATLKARGFTIWEPDHGTLACGEIGAGRLLEPQDILERINNFFAPKILTGQKFLITAGPTREAIDPVRYISNFSSGKMGYALAAAAQAAGAKVTLISGPTNLPTPPGVEKIDVVTAKEMYGSVMKKIATTDVFVSTAAVADYCVEKVAPQKIKKIFKSLSLKLVPNLDILMTIAKLKKRPLLVGFAAETENLEANAKKKLHEKKIDLIAANLVGKNRGFEQDENEITIFSKNTAPIKLALAPKSKIAEQLIGVIAKHKESKS
jgi:phosphopantothenoylcysteine decarboxylase / phosphopantothenate---cysteine ligase